MSTRFLPGADKMRSSSAFRVIEGCGRTYGLAEERLFRPSPDLSCRRRMVGVRLEPRPGVALGPHPPTVQNQGGARVEGGAMGPTRDRAGPRRTRGHRVLHRDGGRGFRLWMGPGATGLSGPRGGREGLCGHTLPMRTPNLRDLCRESGSRDSVCPTAGTLELDSPQVDSGDESCAAEPPRVCPWLPTCGLAFGAEVGQSE